MTETKIGQLRIWHNSNFGVPPFTKEVDSIREAKDLLKLLADYDLYQGDKIDSNAQGLEEYFGLEYCETHGIESNGGWLEWEDKEGNDIENTEE